MIDAKSRINDCIDLLRDIIEFKSDLGDWYQCTHSALGFLEEAARSSPPGPLKSLADHDAERHVFYAAQRLEIAEGVGTGIACPLCESELIDTNPYVTLTSNPPKKNVHCSADGCLYSGYRLA